MALNPQERKAAADVQLIVGGNFTPDALGPTVHRQTIERVLAAPDLYLRIFERMYVSRPMDLNQHSALYLSNFLKLLSEVRPDRVAALTQRLSRDTDAALAARGAAAVPAAGEAVPEETSRMLQRIDMRRRELRNLLQRLKH